MKNVLLFIAVALFCIEYPTSSTGSSQFVKVGCFKDKRKERALPELLFSRRGNIDWNNLKRIVDDCFWAAMAKNYMYFGIEFYGECWSGKTAPLTYDRYGSSSKCTKIVGTQNTILVYRFVGDEKECINYSTLGAANRSSTFNSPPIGPLSCDKGLSSGWYSFLPPAGNQMASTCVPTRKCGTAVTGWLNTNHPDTTDGIVSGEVCFNWSGNCCEFRQDIRVRDCGRFFVYKLDKTNCPMRFCGETTV